MFANMYAAYEALSDGLKRTLDGMIAIHSASRVYGTGNSRAANRQKDGGKSMQIRTGFDAEATVEHPVVRTHPETGRKAIFLGDHAETIDGMPYAEGRALVDDLNQRATPDHLVYRHHWAPRQCIVWDNRCLLHRATAYDTAREKRVMRRCTILGDEPF